MATTEEPDAPPAVIELAGEFDALARDLLDELATAECHTTHLREASGMSRQTVHRRLDELEEHGLVATEKRTPDAGGQERRHAWLTEHGEELIDEGLLDAIHDTNKNVLALGNKIDRIESELEREIERAERSAKFSIDGKTSRLTDDLDALGDDLEDLEERLTDARREARRSRGDLADSLDAVEETADAARGATRRQEERLDRLEERVAALEERERARAGAVLAHIRELFAAVDDLEERVEAVDADREDHAASVGAAFRDVRERLDDLEEELHETWDATRKLKGFRTNAESRIENLEARDHDTSDLRERVADLEKDLAELREEQRGIF